MLGSFPVEHRVTAVAYRGWRTAEVEGRLDAMTRAYCKGATLTAIGAAFGLTRQRVTTMLAQAEVLDGARRPI